MLSIVLQSYTHFSVEHYYKLSENTSWQLKNSLEVPKTRNCVDDWTLKFPTISSNGGCPILFLPKFRLKAAVIIWQTFELFRWQISVVSVRHLFVIAVCLLSTFCKIHCNNHRNGSSCAGQIRSDKPYWFSILTPVFFPIFCAVILGQEMGVKLPFSGSNYKKKLPVASTW